MHNKPHTEEAKRKMTEIIYCKHWCPVRCPRCGWEGCSRLCGSGDYFAQDGCKCPECYEECVEDDDKEAEARAVWNRRTVPAQQWTTEPPTEEGYYFVFCQKDGIKVVEVYSSGFVVVNGRSGLHIELFVKKFKPLWYKIPTPPLPTQEDAKDE